MKKYNLDLGPSLDFKSLTKKAKAAGFGSLAGLIRVLLIEWDRANPPQA